MFCTFHKERLAHEKCDQCGVPICPDCHRVMNGRIFCPECLSSDFQQQKSSAFRNPVLAALLSIFPGLGQVYNGQLAKGLIIFFSSWLIVPWLYGIYDAYIMAARINARAIDSNPSVALLTGCLVLMILLFGMFAGGPFVILKGLPLMIERVFNSGPEARVKNIFQKISGAAEAYKKDHKVFPADVADLYFGDFTYLDQMYCDTVRRQYRYECRFSAQGYEITAIPLEENLPRFRMTPGPVMEKF